MLEAKPLCALCTHLHCNERRICPKVTRMPGRANQRYAILFRDDLRAFPAMAQAYGQVKEAIVKYHPEQDMEAYHDIKDPVCDIIMDLREFP